MRNTMFVPMTLAGLLLASPIVMAVEANHPDEEGAVTADESGAGLVAVETVETTDESPSAEQPAAMGGPGMMDQGMMGQGMMGGQQTEASSAAAGTTRPGMGMGRSGMMGGQQGQGGGMGMMRQGMMGGGMMDKPKRGVAEMHQQVLGRLDLLEARLAKVETMLERLLQR
jgi:hypothetical protein